jgi:hypothetical protein
MTKQEALAHLAANADLADLVDDYHDCSDMDDLDYLRTDLEEMCEAAGFDLDDLYEALYAPRGLCLDLRA